MDENPYKPSVDITETEAKLTIHVPEQFSNLGGFVLFLALLIGSAGGMVLLKCADDIFHPLEAWPSEIIRPIETWPSENKFLAIAGLIGVAISLGLLWLTIRIEQGKKASSIAGN